MTGAVLLNVDVSWRRGDLDLDIALDVGAGEVVAVLGPNGAGKTSLLHAIAGLDTGASGTVTVDGETVLGGGRHVAPELRSVGLMFQQHLLFPWLDVRDNVAFGLRAQGMRRGPARRQAEEWLDRYGLGALWRRRPDELSGGQAQRVALVRALAPRPLVLLLDEPLAALDVSTRHEVRRDLRRLLADHQGATVLVTHDPLDAFALARRAVIVESGRVVQRGTLADLARRPRSEFTAGLLGVNVYRGMVNGGGHMVELDDGSRLEVAAEGSGAVFVAVRPNAVAVHNSKPTGATRNTWEGEIDAVEPAAGRVRVHVAASPPIVAEVTEAAVADLELAPGRRVWVSVKATEIDVYPA